MEKIDGRGISWEALEERRRTIIRMKENGFTEKQITAAVGCSRQTISPLWNKYIRSKDKKGGGVFEVKRRGIKYGERRTLTIEQEQKIREIMVDKYPDQLRFDFALWTREAVKLLIQKKCGIAMPIRTVGEYLKRWGYTPQKPVKYAYERDKEKVENWLKKEYPEIQRQAKREKLGFGHREDGVGLQVSRYRPSVMTSPARAFMSPSLISETRIYSRTP